MVVCILVVQLYRYYYYAVAAIDVEEAVAVAVGVVYAANVGVGVVASVIVVIVNAAINAAVVRTDANQILRTPEKLGKTYQKVFPTFSDELETNNKIRNNFVQHTLYEVIRPNIPGESGIKF